MEQSKSTLNSHYFGRGLKGVIALKIINLFWALLIKKKPSFIINNPRKILVCNFAHLGDVVISTSILPALKKKFPNAEIGFLCASWSSFVLKNHPLIKKIHLLDHWKLSRAKLSFWKKIKLYFSMRKKALKEIKAEKYDIGIDLIHYFPNSIFLLWQAKIPTRIAYTSAGFESLLTHPKIWEDSDKYMSSYHLHLIEDPKIEKNYTPPPFLKNFSNEELSNLKNKFTFLSQKYLIFHVSCEDRHREWEVSKWRELALKFSSYTIIFTGKGEREATKIEEIVCNLSNCHNLCNLLDFDEFTLIIKEASLLISTDTVSVHIGFAFNVPSLIFFSGIKKYQYWLPKSNNVDFVINRLPCTPCDHKKGCLKTNTPFACIRDINVEEVFEKSNRLLINCKSRIFLKEQ